MRKEKAVALGYNKGDIAPKVLARGQGHCAEYLKRIAAEHEIPIIESFELTESLINFNPLDDIPEQYWNVVAEILKFVYETRANNAMNSE